MLANRRLFSAHQAHAVAEKVRTLVVPSLDSLQRGAAEPIAPVVANMVKRALERSPSERYAGTTALLQALETQTREFMAAPETVQLFLLSLVGNIFDSRLRAMERAVNNSEQYSASSPIAAPVPTTGGASRDPRPRAAVTENPPAPLAATQRPAPVPSASKNTTVDAYEALDPDSLAPEPDTLRDSPPELSGAAPKATSELPKPMDLRSPDSDGERPLDLPRLPSMPSPPARTSKPAPVVTAKPPLATAIPTLPSRFELPGAELFATPGLPMVRPVAHAPESASVPAWLPESLPDAAAVETKANPVAVGTTIPAPADKPNLAPDLAAESESTRPEHRRSKANFSWIAIFSVVACAFAVGIALRRCTSHPSPATSVKRADVALQTPLPDASMVVTAQGAIVSPQLDASASDAGRYGVDASAPSASAGPEAQPTPARTFVRRSVPRSNGKVAKGRGKTARTH